MKTNLKETRSEFLKALKDRGMKEVKMFVSDAHEGILHGICKHYPESPWQRCQAHFSRNILDKAPSKYKKEKGLAAKLKEM